MRFRLKEMLVCLAACGAMSTAVLILLLSLFYAAAIILGRWLWCNGS